MDLISINLSNPKTYFTSQPLRERVSIFYILMGEGAHRLYRSRRDRIFAGVGGGLGEYFGFDPIVFRALMILLAVFGNPIQIILVYLALVIVIPDEAQTSEMVLTPAYDVVTGFVKNITNRSSILMQHADKTRAWFEYSRNIIGLALILVGIGLLWAQLFSIPWLNRNLIWAGVLLALGLYIIVKSTQHADRTIGA